MQLFDATSDYGTICFSCGHQLTKSNAWSGWECLDCHESEEDARGVNRPALLHAMTEYNRMHVSHAAKLLAAAIVLLPFALLIGFTGHKQAYK